MRSGGWSSSVASLSVGFKLLTTESAMTMSACCGAVSKSFWFGCTPRFGSNGYVGEGFAKSSSLGGDGVSDVVPARELIRLMASFVMGDGRKS